MQPINFNEEFMVYSASFQVRFISYTSITNTIFGKFSQPEVTSIHVWWPCDQGNHESAWYDIFIMKVNYNYILLYASRYSSCSILNENWGGKQSLCFNAVSTWSSMTLLHLSIVNICLKNRSLWLPRGSTVPR